MACTPATITLTMNNISSVAPPEYFCTVQDNCPNIVHTWQNFDTVEVGLTSPVSVFPLPESTEGARDAIIVKVEGNSQLLRITWTIKDELTTDITGGTLTGCDTVSTQFEQLEFWTTTFENRSIDQSFTFKICTGVACEAYTRVVLLRDFKATISSEAPVTWNASLDMIVGKDVNNISEN